MTRSWSGAAQSGSRDYEPADVERVLDALPRGRQEAVTRRTFAGIVGMEDRTIRAILSDMDGIHFLMASDGDLFWDAEFAEEAYGHTEMLRARARSEMERVGRRERYTRTTLPERQPRLIA
jgi:hypothetical protein